MSEHILKNPTRSAAPLSHFPIGGITPLTTIDFPGRLAAVLYTQGCPWRCVYCHNASLWPFCDGDPKLEVATLEIFLKSRIGLLDGVVFSGGEPTVHDALGDLMQWVRGMGFEIGLHTNGMFPEKLREILPLCHWVAMDVKAPPSEYDTITQRLRSSAGVFESAQLLCESGVSYEFRTTFHPDLLSEGDLLDIAQSLVALGAKNYALQIFKSSPCVNGEWMKRARGGPILISEPLLKYFKTHFESFVLRN